MSSHSKPDDGKSTEMTALVFIILLIGGMWLIWAKGRHGVVFPIFAADWLQYQALDKLGLLDRTGHGWLAYITGVLDGRRGVYEVEWQDITDLQADIGMRMRWPIAVICFGLAVLALFKMKGEGFKVQYSLAGRSYEEVVRFCGLEVKPKFLKQFLTGGYSWAIFRYPVRALLAVTALRKLVSIRKEWVNKGASFAHYQARHWKVTLVGANFDPNKNDPGEAPQLSPMEWIRDNKIRLNKKDLLDEDATEAAFERQLGPTWQGIDGAPYHVQAICVLAALNVKRDKGIEKLRERLTEIHVLQRPKAEQLTREAIAPYLKDEKIRAALNRRGGKHAFLNTAAVAIYGWGGPMREWGGGQAGVLSTSMFRWLKAVDRTLWYALNNVGRRAYHIEGAGVVSHFQAERVLGQPLADPYMECAIDGVQTYLEEQALDDVEAFFKVDKDF